MKIVNISHFYWIMLFFILEILKFVKKAEIFPKFLGEIPELWGRLFPQILQGEFSWSWAKLNTKVGVLFSTG